MAPVNRKSITGTVAATLSATVMLLAGCASRADYGKASRRSSTPHVRVPGHPDSGGTARVRKASPHPAHSWERVGTFDELWVIQKPDAATLPAPVASRPGQGQLAVFENGKKNLLPLEHTDVTARISALLSVVKVRQRFRNSRKEPIEVVYTFPLPGDAAVTDFLMTVGRRRIRGIIRERRDVRLIYEEARRQGYVAALLTQKRPNVFSSSVAGIRPGKPIDVEVTYFAPLRYSAGELEFVFPMTVPRSSAARADSPPARRNGRDIAINVHFDAGVAIEKVYSRSHVLDAKRKSASGSGVSVKLAAAGEIPNRDFVLRCKLTGKQPKAALLTHRSRRGNYFALLLCPPETASGLPRVKREVCFILDGSGSMRRGALEQGKRLVVAGLKSLTADDTFQVSWLADKTASLGPKPAPASPDNVNRAIARLAGLKPSGFAALTPTLLAALEMPADPTRRRVICLVTDGHIGDEAKALAVLKRERAKARVYACGVGPRPNRYLVENLAMEGGGAAAFLAPGETVEAFAKAFSTSSSRPALTDVRVEWGGIEVEGVYPRKTPDLVVGRPVLLVGRFSGAGKQTLRVIGNAGGKKVSLPLSANLDATASAHPGIEKLWARWRIKELHARESLRPTRDLRRSITETALRHGLLSRYTSMMIVDTTTRD